MDIDDKGRGQLRLHQGTRLSAEALREFEMAMRNQGALRRAFVKKHWEDWIRVFRRRAEQEEGPLSPMLSTDITTELQKAVQKAGISKQPKLVKVRPLNGSVPNDCYDNIEDAIPELGKAHTPGWRVEEHELYFVFHAHDVLRTHTNDLIDITPQALDVEQMVFVPDGSQKWSGRPNPSLYVPRRKKGLVVQWAELMGRLSRLWARAWEEELGTGEVWMKVRTQYPDVWQKCEEVEMKLANSIVKSRSHS